MKSAAKFAVGVAIAIAIGAAVAAQQAEHQVPARRLPVPDTVSPAMHAIITAPPSATWKASPATAAEWKALIDANVKTRMNGLADLRDRLGVTSQATKIAGVNVFTIAPSSIPPEHAGMLLVNVHGGAYVFGPGESGTKEAVLMAGMGRFKVVAIDYRMPPDFPYPAALDDAMAVWKELIKTNDPRKMAIFGTSTGGGMTLAMVLRAKRDGLPLPGALGPGTPWSDLTKTGDSYYTNEFVDNSLVAYDGWLASAALLYANGHDLKDPMLSPVYGDFSGFPPAILTTGTRDLFLSNTVRVHRKLRAAGVEADLHVFEGQSHGQYGVDASASETREHFSEVTRFFEKHLGGKN